MEQIFLLPITTLAAVLNGAILFFLTVGIALTRKKNRVSHGDGGDARFAKRQRGHSNAVEQIPITLALLLLAELQGAPDWLCWGAAIALTLGRFSHAVQFWVQGAPFLLRPLGIYLTLLAQLALLIWLAALVLI